MVKTNSDKLVKKVVQALLKEQLELTREGIEKFGMGGHSTAVKKLVSAWNEILLDNKAMLPKLVPDILVDSITSEEGTTKIERYHRLAHYLGNKVGFLESRSARMLLGGIPFLTKGIEIDEKDSDGNPIIVTPGYIRDKLLEIVDELQGFSKYVIKYTEGMVDAFDVAQRGDPKIYREAVSLNHFVKSPDAKLYALLRMLVVEPGDRPTIIDDLVTEREVLMGRYQDFSEKYLAGPNDKEHKLGEWSYIAQKPIDLILTTAKALVKVTGDTKHWMALLKFFSEPERGFRNIESTLQKADNVGEEAREDVHGTVEGLYKILRSSMALTKKALNWCGQEMYSGHMQVLGSLGARPESQRRIVMKYTSK